MSGATGVVSSPRGDNTYPGAGGGAECGDDDRRLAMASSAYETPSRCAGTLFRRWNGDIFYPPNVSLWRNVGRSPAHKSGLSAPLARRSSFTGHAPAATPAHEVQSWPPQSQALTETDGPTADAAITGDIWFSGFGYIITATYLPLFFIRFAAQQIDPVQIWALFGLAAVPSCFIWHKLVVKLGFRRALTVNLLIRAAGVVLPALSQALLSAYSARCWSVLPLWAPLPLRSRKPEG